MKPITRDAVRLFHEGSIALAQISANGFRIDTDYVDRTIDETKSRASKLSKRLKECREWSLWQKQFGTDANINSDDQLATILYKVLGYECHEYTKTGKPSTDVTAIERIDSVFTRNLGTLRKLQKAEGTFLHGIKQETVNGFVHPFFNLHTTLTLRGSSDHINFQNQPIRDPLLGELIRNSFIPRSNKFRIVEIDYSVLEVSVAACYHHDPVMLKYLAGVGDMHRDMAQECYLLSSSEVWKPIRQQAKALFVFAEFYGDYYVSCAASLWDAIRRHKLKTQDGICLYDHLASKGITERGACVRGSREDPVAGTFEHHIKEVESRFWNERFVVYNQWRKDWYAAYQQNGGFNTLSGYRIEGNFSRNFVINCPVQGSAFHCLLWSLTKLHQWLVKHKMKSVIMGNIHDSIVLDVHDDEFDDVIPMARKIMTEDIHREWPWLITPLKVEIETSETTWFDKKPLVV